VAYYAFVLTANLLFYFLIEYYLSPIVSRRNNSAILQGVSQNQLAFFLIANLITGGVNNLIKTLEVSDDKAMLILGAYIFTMCSFASACHYYGWRIKL
jgi:GWT1